MHGLALDDLHREQVRALLGDQSSSLGTPSELTPTKSSTYQLLIAVREGLEAARALVSRLIEEEVELDAEAKRTISNDFGIVHQE